MRLEGQEEERPESSSTPSAVVLAVAVAMFTLSKGSPLFRAPSFLWAFSGIKSPVRLSGCNCVPISLVPGSSTIFYYFPYPCSHIYK